MDLARASRRAPLTACKKGSGYENACVALGHSVRGTSRGRRGLIGRDRVKYEKFIHQLDVYIRQYGCLQGSNYEEIQTYNAFFYRLMEIIC
jgi:hypothetical protein